MYKLPHKKLTIGFFFWGFITDPSDSPDGAGLERFYFIRELIKKGHRVVCLGVNRDEDENSYYLGVERSMLGHGFSLQDIQFEANSLPKNLDMLIIEWRWPIPGRSTPDMEGKEGHTPDVAIQDSLIKRYYGNIPVFIWDTDLRITDNELERMHDAKFLMPCEIPKIKPDKWITLPWPYDHSDMINQFNVHFGNWDSNKYSLIYIGNNYRRDKAINEFVWPVAQKLDVHFVGNWNKYPDKWADIKNKWPNINYYPRIGRDRFAEFYGRAYTTILLVPDDYFKARAIGTRFCQAIAWATIPMCHRDYLPLGSLLPEICLFSDWQELYTKILTIVQLPKNQIALVFEELLRVAQMFDSSTIVERFLEFYNE